MIVPNIWKNKNVQWIHIYHQPQLRDTLRNHQPLKSNKPICFRLWSRHVQGKERKVLQCSSAPSVHWQVRNKIARQAQACGLTLPLKFWHSGVLHSRVRTKLLPPTLWLHGAGTCTGCTGYVPPPLCGVGEWVFRPQSSSSQVWRRPP